MVDPLFARHCQLKQAWYASWVGGAMAQCGEVLGPPIGVPSSQPRGAGKLTSTPCCSISRSAARYTHASETITHEHWTAGDAGQDGPNRPDRPAPYTQVQI
jgi:hypothetical protein